MIEIHSTLPGEPKNSRWWTGMILNDLFFMNKVVLHHGKKVEYRDLNWVHRKLCDFIDFKKNPVPEKLVLMSRDLLKSSIAKGFIVQWFLRKRVISRRGKIFLYSGIFDLAQDQLERIVKELIENELLQKFFSRILPHKKSDFDVLALDKGKLRYKGIEIDIGSPEKSLTGHHYEGGIDDNLVNEVNSTTKTQREKTIIRFNQQEPTLIENAWKLIFETPWWPDDLSGDILDPEDHDFDYSLLYRKPCQTFISPKGYSVFSCPCRDEEGNPVMPEKLDEVYLERKRKNMGPYLYNALYELQPVMEEEAVFQKQWIVHIKKLPNPFVRNLAVDMAGTLSDESSFTGISIGEWDVDGNLNIPYAQKRKLTPMKVKDWVIRLIYESEKANRPFRFIIIEKEKFGIYLADHLRVENIDPHIVLSEIEGKKRMTRFEELVPKFESGMIRSFKGLKDYETGVRTYYRGKKKETDILDTVYLHFKVRAASIPRRTKVSDFIMEETSDFAKQIKKDIESHSRGQREIASIF